MTPINVCTAVKLVVNRFAQNVYDSYYAYGWCCSQKVVPFNKNSESRLATSSTESDGQLWACIGPVSRAPVPKFWDSRLLFHFFSVPVEEGPVRRAYRYLQKWSRCFIHKACCISFCATSNNLEWSQCRCIYQHFPKELPLSTISKRPGLMVMMKTLSYHCQECPHTNNYLEGWHNQLKRVARKAYPNMFNFIKRLQNGLLEVTIQQLSGGGRFRLKERNMVWHEESIKRLTEELSSGIQSLD